MKGNDFKRIPPKDNIHDKFFFRTARRSKRYAEPVKPALVQKRSNLFDRDSAELMENRPIDIE